MPAANELPVPFVYSGTVLSAAITLPIFAIIAVGLRFLTRKAYKRSLGWDDWTILASLVFVIAMGVALIYGCATRALGYPTITPPDLSPEEQVNTLLPKQSEVELIYWITWVVMIPANGFIKLSALFLYRRIFVVNRGSAFDITTKAMLVICASWMIAFELATIFGCGSHFDYPWGTLGQLGSCGTDPRVDGMMISDLATDLMVWLLPIPIVWSLNMRISKKVSASLVLLLAAMSLAAAIVRLIVDLYISYGGYGAHTDINLTLTSLLYWTMIESGLALIAACLPTLRALVGHQTIQQGWLKLSSASHILPSIGTKKTTVMPVPEDNIKKSGNDSEDSGDRGFIDKQQWQKGRPSVRDHFELSESPGVGVATSSWERLRPEV